MMTSDPKPTEFDPPTLSLDVILGPTSLTLLRDDIVLLFDGDTGLLLEANEKAMFALGFDSDSPIAPSFTETVVPDGDLPDTVWHSALGGESPQLQCTLAGAMDLRVDVAASVAMGQVSDTQTCIVLIGKAIPDAPVQEAAPAPGGNSVIDQAIGVLEYDMDGNVISANDRATMAMEAFGEDIVGRNHDTLWPDSMTNSEEYIEFWNKLRQGRTIEGRHQHITMVDSEVWFQSVYVPVKGPDGHVSKMVQCLVDVTKDTFKAQVSIERSAAMWLNMAACEYDPEGHVTAMNERMLRLLAYTEEEVIGLNDERFCDREFARSKKYKDTWAALALGQVQKLHIRQRTKRNGLLWVMSTLVPIMSTTGKLIRVLKISEDVTEAHGNYLDASGKLSAVDTMLGIFEMNRSGQITEANSTYCKLVVADQQDVVNKPYKDFCSPAFAAAGRFNEFLDKLNNGETVSGRFERRTAQGGVIWVQATYVPLMTPTGNWWKVVAFVSDITEAQLREQALAGRVSAVEKAQCAVEYDLEGNVLSANDRFLDLVKYSIDTIKGQNHSQFCPDHHDDCPSSGFLGPRASEPKREFGSSCWFDYAACWR